MFQYFPVLAATTICHDCCCSLVACDYQKTTDWPASSFYRVHLPSLLLVSSCSSSSPASTQVLTLSISSYSDSRFLASYWDIEADLDSHLILRQASAYFWIPSKLSTRCSRVAWLDSSCQIFGFGSLI